jgi:hypothetical protein
MPKIKRLSLYQYKTLVRNVRLFMQAKRTLPAQPQTLEAMVRVAAYLWHTALRSAGCDFP